MVVKIAKSFQKDLRAKPKTVIQAVRELIADLEDAENLEKSGVDYAKMEGQRKGESYFRIRLGNWRIGIEYIHPEIIVIRILARGEGYKHFPPK